MDKQAAIQFIARALGEYADTMSPLNKELFIERSQEVVDAINKLEEKPKE